MNPFCIVKTHNGALGVNPDGNVIEYAKERGKSTGVAARCTAKQATMAPLFAYGPGVDLVNLNLTGTVATPMTQKKTELIYQNPIK